jgi:predicted O-linked N-acetylglucosamine transferase (SPINDLY family)
VLANSRDPDRKLPVGYVSPDFRDHPHARFALPVFRAHDRSRVEVVCYSDVARPDAVTELFRAAADEWRDVSPLSDEKMAELIREDRVVVLVDLAGHMDSRRMLVFARRPAPVQAEYLGYPNSTGMQSIGYRITDAVTDPLGEADRLHTETLVRLPGCP